MLDIFLGLIDTVHIQATYMRVSLGSVTSIFLVLLMLSIVALSGNNHSYLEEHKIGIKHSDGANSSINFTSSGESGIAISGEPAHVGDELTATVLVSNSGNHSNSVSLHILSQYDQIGFQGQNVEISPGSTREVSARFSPITPGENKFDWWLSVGGNIDSIPLSGNFSLEVMPSQQLDLSIDNIDWQLENGLNFETSVFLSDGKSREIILEIMSISQGSEKLLQRIVLDSDPGRRELSFNLGHPLAEMIVVEAFPISWLPSNDSVNLTSSSVQRPLVDQDSLLINAEFNPIEASPGSNVLISVSLENIGTSMAGPGDLRIIKISDMAILSQVSVQSVMPGSTVRTEMNVPNWPIGDRIDLEVQWSTSGLVVSNFYSIESNLNEGPMDLPFDPIAAGYGILAGILTILVGTFAWRAVSTRTPSTADLTLRETKTTQSTMEKKEKREIKCSFCDQKLMVPSGHEGGVRCPSCTMEFSVGEPEESPPMVVSSSEDTLSCPQCEQILRVKLENRPVMSRCPICKTNFLAEAEVS